MEQLRDLNEEEFGRFLVSKGFPEEVVSTFKMQSVDGESFLDLTEDDLKELVPVIGFRSKLRRLRDSSVSASSCMFM